MHRERSYVPWWLEDADLNPANNGEVELSRDLRVGDHRERHIGMHVVGQFDRGLSLGLVTIRSERQGKALVPMTLSIPETPIVITEKPAMDMTLLSNPRRYPDTGSNSVEDRACD